MQNREKKTLKFINYIRLCILLIKYIYINIFLIKEIHSIEKLYCISVHWKKQSIFTLSRISRNYKCLRTVQIFIFYSVKR